MFKKKLKSKVHCERKDEVLKKYAKLELYKCTMLMKKVVIERKDEVFKKYAKLGLYHSTMLMKKLVTNFFAFKNFK